MAEQKRPTATETYTGQEVVANEVILKFKPGFSSNRQALEKSYDVDYSEAIGDGTPIVIHSKSRNTGMLVQSLSERIDLVYAQPNYIVYADVLPNDANFGLLWGMLNAGQNINGTIGIAGDDIKAPQAWDISTGSRANVVAVVDTGVDYTHPDLAANIWTAPRAFSLTIGGTNVTCPAGAHGYNAITHTFDPLDDNNHGSHCSGTIGGVGNNGIGVAGVNWTASIMGCKFLGSGGSGQIADAVNAIEFAVQAKIVLGADANVRVLSNSWGGGGFSQPFLDEMNRANANNMLFVCAAGNNSSNNDANAFYPASYNTVNEVAVAATDNTDHMASFSNYGATTVQLGAPGVNVYSSIRGGGYAFFNGTSMATPHVAGAADLMLSINGTLTTAQIKAALMSTVDPIAALQGRTITGGRLNLFRAVNSVVPQADFSLTPVPTSVTLAQGTVGGTKVLVGATNGFNGAVSFTFAGQAPGMFVVLNQSIVRGSGSIAVRVSSNASTPVGTYPLTITGTSGSTSHSIIVPVTVILADFAIGVSPGSGSISHGETTSTAVSVTAFNSFNGVTLSASGLPLGATATFAPNTIQGTGGSTLKIGTSLQTPPGDYTVTVTGTAGTVSHSIPFALHVG